jgi:hypothetical protein
MKTINFHGLNIRVINVQEETRARNRKKSKEYFQAEQMELQEETLNTEKQEDTFWMRINRMLDELFDEDVPPTNEDILGIKKKP